MISYFVRKEETPLLDIAAAVDRIQEAAHLLDIAAGQSEAIAKRINAVPYQDQLEEIAIALRALLDEAAASAE